MASKKKSSAKRKSSKSKKVKYAAKNHASSTSSSARKSASTNQATQWAQKGVSDWAKQSAKLYQMPFAQGANAGDVAQNAAANVQSATENMVKMGTDMMQQFFGQTTQAGREAVSAATSAASAAASRAPSFDPQAAKEKITSFTRDSSEQFSKSASSATRALNEAMELARENGEAFVEVSNIAITVSKELGAELGVYLNQVFTQNVELSKQVLTCRTLNDLFDLSSSIMKANLDGFFSESVKLSEKLFQCATDVSEPLNERVSETTQRMTKAIAA